MDIRDIKESVTYPGINSFLEIFNLQKSLLTPYIEIEGLPPYPIDINTRQAQTLIKDFIARIIEELGEGFESYVYMIDQFHKGVGEKQMIPHLQNFNEEISDAIHFWLELIIYSGYEIPTLKEWLSYYYNHSFNPRADYLGEYFSLGNALVLSEIGNLRLPSRMVIKDDELQDEFLRGGRMLSSKRKDIMRMFLWDITYWLQIARNSLKNKPWKQTEMMTDLSQYEDGIREATAHFFKFLSFTGFTPESFYTIYYKKNKVNQFRIKSKY